MFNIDKVTSEAIISFNDHLEGEEAKTTEKHGDGKIKYLRYDISSSNIFTHS